MQIESIRHFQEQFFFFFFFANIEGKTIDGNCPEYAGLDLLPFETSFRCVFVNMLLFEDILEFYAFPCYY